VFGGTVAGTLTFAMGPRPSVKLISSLQGVDVAAAMAFAGSPDTMTGHAAGRVDVEAVGVTAAEVVRTVSGTARFDVSDGTVRGLGLVRAVVLAGSMRAESQAQAAARKTTDGESFSRLGLSMTIANGVARTTDLQFESPDVRMNAAGVLALASVHVDLAGDVQLSDDLSKSAGRDLVRYTGEGGRATLPITVAGPVSDLRVRVDVTDAARRALENRAAEEAKKALSKVLGRIIT
jgi:AsmA protein